MFGNGVIALNMLDPATVAGERIIDPFGYWPDLSSAIAGLKDGQAGSDRNYVFHTAYLAQQAGANSFAITFDGLRAQQGVLNIRVFSYSESRGRVIEQVEALEIGLPRLAKRRRPVAIAFEATEDRLYAISGYLLGESDAVASGIEVRLMPGVSLTEGESGTERSFLGSGMARRVDMMTADAAATLAFPVSQGFTTAQTLEPIFKAWVKEARCEEAAVHQQWEAAYVLQVLSSYGRLTSGALGLGMGLGESPIAAVARARGCTIHQIAALSTAQSDITRDAAVTDGPRLADFLWSPSDQLHRSHRHLVWQYIDDGLDLLAPAGLGVFMLPVATAHRPPESAQGDMLDLNDVKRLMLNIVSAGHIVAQLRNGTAQRSKEVPLASKTPGEDQTVPYGLIIRKFAPESRES